MKTVRRIMPQQKPHRSKQAVRTPPEFIEAVRQRFGKIGFDLAASPSNSVAGQSFFGPRSSYAFDALRVPWAAPLRNQLDVALAWLNPPFGTISPWAAKCVEESAAGLRIALLVPASVGSDWFNNFVRPRAFVLELAPRLTFVGHDSSYPKDLVLCIFERQRLSGREAWRWDR